MQSIKRYMVRYSLMGNPNRFQDVVINAPSMQYIKNNWYAICGGKPFVLQKISLVR